MTQRVHRRRLGDAGSDDGGAQVALQALLVQVMAVHGIAARVAAHRRGREEPEPRPAFGRALVRGGEGVRQVDAGPALVAILLPEAMRALQLGAQPRTQWTYASSVRKLWCMYRKRSRRASSRRGAAGFAPATGTARSSPRIAIASAPGVDGDGHRGAADRRWPFSPSLRQSSSSTCAFAKLLYFCTVPSRKPLVNSLCRPPLPPFVHFRPPRATVKVDSGVSSISP